MSSPEALIVCPPPVFPHSYVGAHHHAIAALSTSPYASDVQMSVEEDICLVSVAIRPRTLASPQASSCRISRFFWRAVLSSILVDSGSSVGYNMSLGHRVEDLRILLVPVICRQKLIRG
jgi:hypothetical protein